jgi:hypothetical protein
MNRRLARFEIFIGCFETLGCTCRPMNDPSLWESSFGGYCSLNFQYLFPSQDVLRSVQCPQYLQEKRRLGFLLSFCSYLVTPPQPLFAPSSFSLHRSIESTSKTCSANQQFPLSTIFTLSHLHSQPMSVPSSPVQSNWIVLTPLSIPSVHVAWYVILVDRGKGLMH